MRSGWLVVLLFGTLAHNASATTGELIKVRVSNAIKRASFDRQIRRGQKLVAATTSGLEEAGVHIAKPPKFGMKDAQADSLLGGAMHELDLLWQQPVSPSRNARIGTLAAQIKEYERMPRTGPRTSAFVLPEEDQIYLRLDRKGATPSMLANTISHEQVHIRDRPKTNALWDAHNNSPADDKAYYDFLKDGETRAYGEGSRVGARLGEPPFGLGQPITDINAPDHPLVQRSITRNYMRGVDELVRAKGLFANATPQQRSLAQLYLAGYRSEMPEVLAVAEAWKRVNPPKDGFVEDVKAKLQKWSSKARRVIALATQPPIRSAAEAFDAGKADVHADLHPLARLQQIAK